MTTESGRVFVIAESGSCHGGQFAKATACVLAAQRAGADAVKFQWTSNPRRMEQRRGVPEGTYDRLAFPVGWHSSLAMACQKIGIEYISTVYLPEDVPIIAPFVRRFKVSSFESLDRRFLRAHRPFLDADRSKRLVVSCGMASYDEVEDLSVLTAPINGIDLLHCVSGYPTPEEEMNLRAIHEMDFDGFSDHTGHHLAGSWAVLAGARIVEVHFRLDDTPADDPDYGHSLSPEGLRLYVDAIRQAERILGDGVKRVMPSEEPNLRYRVKGASCASSE